MSQATQTPRAEDRNWFAAPPADWAGWLSFEKSANASRRSRESLLTASTRLDADKDHRLLGLALLACGEPQRAYDHLVAADDELCTLLAGHALAQLGRQQAALPLWQGLVKSRVVGVRARLFRMEEFARLRDAEALNKELAELTALKPDPADQAYAEGLAAEIDGDHQGAIASWRMALQHDPHYHAARFRLALRLDLESEDDEALALLREGLDNDETVHIGSLINLGVSYEDRDEFDAAARCFRAALTADPTNGRARRYLADAEASRRQYYDETRQRRADLHNAVLRIPVTDFELSVRARNCLQRMNIHTLGDLICRTEAELLSFKNFGETSLQEVKDILVVKNLRLGMLPGGRLSGSVFDEDVESDELDDAAAPAEPAAGSPEEATARPIADLELSVRCRAALSTLGINTVGQLTSTSEATLLACRNFGQTSLLEIKSKLSDLGLALAS